MTRTLASDVSELMANAVRLLGDPDGELAGLAASFAEPMTLAVAGHTNAGKSTLVNALIGHRVARTAATECTRVVTWYRFGPQQPEIIYRDGSRGPLWLVADPNSSDRRLPDTLPIPEGAAVERLDVPLSFEPLRAFTVIDTPGLSGDAGLARQTETLLASGVVDVLLFVFGDAEIRASESDVVNAFRRRTRSRYSFPANAIGVLSRADTYPGPDPFTAAGAVADSHAATFRRQLAGVLPVMGRLAETTETGALNQTHTDALHTIAALPEDQRIPMLRTASRFQQSAVLSQTQLSQARRIELVERLAIQGIREFSAPGYASSSTPALYSAMRRASGMGLLQRRINSLFVNAATVHKTTRLLAEVERLARRPEVADDVREELLDGIEVLRSSDALHTLNELRALAALYSGACTVGDDTARGALLRLFEETDPASRLACATDDPAQIAGAAATAINVWQAYANTAMDSLASEIARTAVRSASIIRHRLEDAP
ncbi:GTPase [Mycobacterium sp. pR1184]|uniref:GTPase n=1 Tax=Mycobacterium sp. pR1184 TaxID=3238981 RepID=UPI00351B3E83